MPTAQERYDIERNRVGYTFAKLVFLSVKYFFGNLSPMPLITKWMVASKAFSSAAFGS